MNLIVGGYMLAVGVLCVGVGGSTASKLVKLQKTMSSESVVRQRFTELDKNNSGSLGQFSSAACRAVEIMCTCVCVCLSVPTY